jgi:hypothetical protein
MDIFIKSIGFLVDELITTNVKCFMLQEALKDDSYSMEELGEIFIKVQQLNDRRNKLIRALDERWGDGDLSPTTKTYHTYFNNK